MVLCEPAGQNLPRVAILDVDGMLLNSDMVGTGLARREPSRGVSPAARCRSRRLAGGGRRPADRSSRRRRDRHGHHVARSASFQKTDAIAGAGLRARCGSRGASYLATAADQIVVHPTSIVGGIGVILNLYNLQDTMAQFNIAAETDQGWQANRSRFAGRRARRRRAQAAAIHGRFVPAAISPHRARSPQEGRRQRGHEFRRPGVHRRKMR